MMKSVWLTRIALVLSVCAMEPCELHALEELEVVVKEKEKGKAKEVGGAAVRAIFKAFVPVRMELPAFPVARPPRPAVIRGEPGISLTALDTDKKLSELEAQILKRGGKKYLERFAPKFDGICREELRFMHQICRLQRSQFLTIQKTADKASRKALLESVRVQIAMEQGWAGNRQPQHPDTQGLMEETLVMSSNSELSKEQASRYRQEIEARRLFRKAADAELILCGLDNQLMLTSEQRLQLVGPMIDAWTNQWHQYVELVANNGNQYLPPLPRAAFHKVLTREQRAVFDSMPQTTGIHFGMQMHDLPELPPHEGPLEDELEFAPEEDSP